MQHVCSLYIKVLLLGFSMTYLVQSFAWGGVRRKTDFQSQTRSITVLISQSASSSRLRQRYLHATSSLYSSSSSSRINTLDNGKQVPTAKQRIVFLGTPEVAATTLQTLYDASILPTSTFEIAAVVTQPTKRRKRNGPDESSAVGLVAEQLGLPVLTPEKANDSAFLDALLNEWRPDLCVTAAYGQYLPKRFLATPRLGTVNLHPSLLPKWRGAAPVQRSLQAGDPVVGVTVLYTVSRMDAGPTIAQQTLAINETETATTLLPTLFGMGTRLLLSVLPDILQGQITMATATVQDESHAVAADKIDASEAELRVWEESATTCHNRLRGFHMWPQTHLWLSIGAHDTESSDDEVIQVKVLQTCVVPGSPVATTNVVQLGPTKQSGLYVVCYDGSILELLMVQPATRRAFAARDLQNGYPGSTLRWVPRSSCSNDTTVAAKVASLSTKV